MALLQAKVTIEDRDLGNILPGKLLRHTYVFPYEANIDNLISTNQCTISDPPGFQFIPASDLDLELAPYPFNLLIPDTYDIIVIYQGSDTVDLNVGELLVLNQTFYEVLVPIPSGSTILPTQVLDVTDTIIFAPREVRTINVPGQGVYDVPSGNFCPLLTIGNLTSANVEYIFDGEPIYRDLPLNTYNLGTLENRDIPIIQTLSQLSEISNNFPEGTTIYVASNARYYLITDTIGSFMEKTDGMDLISPTRFLLKGADAGIDFLTKKTQEYFDSNINPSTCKIESLEWVSQLFGLDGLASGSIYSDNFLQLLPNQNPLSQNEIRTLLDNAQGWARPLDMDFNGVVELYDTRLTTTLDFVFDGINRFIFTGDKGIRLNEGNEELNAIEPTDDTTITLINPNTEEEFTATIGDRIHGVVYDRPAFLNRKGMAMQPFLSSIPSSSGENRFVFNVVPDDYTQGLQIIEYSTWLDNQKDIDLLPGYIYHLVDSTGVAEPLLDFSSIITPNPAFANPDLPIGDITDDGSGGLFFTVNPELDAYSQQEFVWEDYFTLKFTISPIQNVVEPVEFSPQNWKGVVGSSGTTYGITVANTIINLENKVPTETAQGITVTRTQTEQEYEKAKLLENYIGSPDILTHTQHENIVSDISRANDFWFEDFETPREITYLPSDQFLYYPVTDQILSLNPDEDVLRIDSSNTLLSFPDGAILMTDGTFIYYYDPFLSQVFKSQREDPLSPYDVLDFEVYSVNASHGYYLKETGFSTIPVTVMQDKREVLKLFGVSTRYNLLLAYPWLRTSEGINFRYQDLTGKHLTFVSDTSFDLSSSDGAILYNPGGEILSVENVSEEGVFSPVDLGVDVYRIEPDYSESNYYDFLDNQFQFYQIGYLDMGVRQVKYLDKNQLTFSKEYGIDLLTSEFSSLLKIFY